MVLVVGLPVGQHYKVTFSGQQYNAMLPLLRNATSQYLMILDVP